MDEEELKELARQLKHLAEAIEKGIEWEDVYEALNHAISPAGLMLTSAIRTVSSDHKHEFTEGPFKYGGITAMKCKFCNFVTFDKGLNP